MFLSLVLISTVAVTTPRPELVMPEPTTRSALLLEALQQAEDDFRIVQRELGLAGSAPLAGLSSNDSPAPSAKGAPRKAGVRKAAFKHPR